MQAAILSHKLKTYNKVIERRREVAQMYQDRLGDLSELQLPPSPSNTSNHFDVYQNYEITADKRDDLKVYLSEKNIEGAKFLKIEEITSKSSFSSKVNLR